METEGAGGLSFSAAYLALQKILHSVYDVVGIRSQTTLQSLATVVKCV